MDRSSSYFGGFRKTEEIGTGRHREKHRSRGESPLEQAGAGIVLLETAAAYPGTNTLHTTDTLQ